MNDRIARLRTLSFETRPSISAERALLETEFYQQEYGKLAAKHCHPAIGNIAATAHHPAGQAVDQTWLVFTQASRPSGYQTL